MKYFIFDIKKDFDLIDSFLETCALAHKEPKKTVDWFKWKFFANPFGPSIMACAKDEQKIVGCVAYGRQDFALSNSTLKGAISFETFVAPSHQGKGIFGTLLLKAEEEVQKRGIELLLNFPNSNSLPGFLKKGWTQINVSEYWVKIAKPVNLIKIAKNIRKPFRPNPSNHSTLYGRDIVHIEQTAHSNIQPIVTSEYLKWRFYAFPVSEYCIVDEDGYYAVARKGKRGTVDELQVLFALLPNHTKSDFNRLLKKIKTTNSSDIISFPISNGYGLKGFIKQSFFIKVPNNTNVCYKILDASVNVTMEDISYSAINYHTY
ncbi:GNAT family N-acetyltransferase [Luteirhabdus pelagi]|uniref:GNAT family N-acetyltransferase n=1 Tax=Luteirhabdus pelagi TaxID=2792783 RepID=UPI00193A4BAF|nr:GNAT family N-acetyltransferase [Luteirhabdus pelagi]